MPSELRDAVDEFVLLGMPGGGSESRGQVFEVTEDGQGLGGLPVAAREVAPAATAAASPNSGAGAVSSSRPR